MIVRCVHGGALYCVVTLWVDSHEDGKQTFLFQKFHLLALSLRVAHVAKKIPDPPDAVLERFIVARDVPRVAIEDFEKSLEINLVCFFVETTVQE